MTLSLLSPCSSSVWSWKSVDPNLNLCGASATPAEGGASALFEQGFIAEGEGDFAQAQSLYTQLLTDYPDSTLALAAAARKLDLQKLTDTTCTDLRDFYVSLASAHAEDTALVEAVNAFATRTYVEDKQYAPALNTYAQVMIDPPSPVDSAYAALDYAITGAAFAIRRHFRTSSGFRTSRCGIVNHQ